MNDKEYVEKVKLTKEGLINALPEEVRIKLIENLMASSKG